MLIKENWLSNYDERNDTVDQICQMMGIPKPTLHKYIDAAKPTSSNKFNDKHSYLGSHDNEVGNKLHQKKYGDTHMPSYHSPASKLFFTIRYELFEEGMKYLR